MNELISIAISNAIVATLLGVLALIISRNTKSTSLAHAVWIVVLLKLVTPPLFHVPLPILPAAQNTTAAITTEPLSESESESFLSGNGTVVLGTASEETVALDDSSSLSMESMSAASVETTSWWQAILNFRSSLLWLWLIGAVAVAVWHIYATWQMCRLMRMAVPDPRIDRSMNRIARNSNIKNYPTARVVPWVGSPMLWGLRGTSVIVLPAKLLDKIDEAAVDTLLQHELAHFQRGDQWVRILEIFVSIIYWWHPLVWFAVRQVEIYEEQCCDAWVVSRDVENRRRYASALLDTVDFISDARAQTLPVVASGLGQVRFLETRLKAIMGGQQELGLSTAGWMTLVAVLVLLPLQPMILRASQPAAVKAEPVLAGGVEASESTDAGDILHEPEGYLNGADIFERTPAPEYAKATSAYGTFTLTAKHGFEVELERVVDGSKTDLSERQISCVAFVPPSKQQPEFVAGSVDGSVWLYDCRSGTGSRKIGTFESSINSVAYSRDGSNLVVGTAAGFVHLLDATTSKIKWELDNKAPVRCVRFSEDGQRIAITTDTTWKASSAGHVKVVDASSAAQQLSIRCPLAVGVAGFNSRGQILTVQWDGLVRIWSTKGMPLASVQKPKDIVSAAAFSPNAVSMETLGVPWSGDDE